MTYEVPSNSVILRFSARIHSAWQVSKLPFVQNIPFFSHEFYMQVKFYNRKSSGFWAASVVWADCVTGQ